MSQAQSYPGQIGFETGRYIVEILVAMHGMLTGAMYNVWKGAIGQEFANRRRTLNRAVSCERGQRENHWSKKNVLMQRNPVSRDAEGLVSLELIRRGCNPSQHKMGHHLNGPDGRPDTKTSRHQLFRGK